MNAVELSLFSHRLGAICEEMGAVLRRSAISPNIRDREDYSCALFDAQGRLIAQAAHIPVHLGSMAYAMHGIVNHFDWQPGDAILFNDPYLGGTHLPDITLVVPVFVENRLSAFAAARAHHADIGGATPGSMGVESRLEDEGLILSPRYWYARDREEPSIRALIHERVRSPDERMGDLSAQRAACLLGASRLREFTAEELGLGFDTLIAVSEDYGHKAISEIPDGNYLFRDHLEDDGLGSPPLPIEVLIKIEGNQAIVDFSGSAAQTTGPVNCPLAVTAASVFYVFRCLMPAHTPQTSAIFNPIQIRAPLGTVVNARPGAPVAAGNVETSQRIVDVVLGALAQAIPERIPAAAQGTMNNIIFGGKHHTDTWVYYETLAGGMGAHFRGDGLTAVQCHMTNTKNTSIEVMEMHYPLRIHQYAIRKASGGQGANRGGDGLIREWEVLEDCHLSLLSERRSSAPYGLNDGNPGARGRNRVLHQGVWADLPAKGSVTLKAGDHIRIETPGGGGFGKAGNIAENPVCGGTNRDSRDC